MIWAKSNHYRAPRKIRVPRGLTSETHCSNWSGWGPRPRQGLFFEVPYRVSALGMPNAPDQKRGPISRIEPSLCTRLLNLDVGGL